MTHLAGMTALARLMQRCPPDASARRGKVCIKCGDRKQYGQFYQRITRAGDVVERGVCKACYRAQMLARRRGKNG